VFEREERVKGVEGRAAVELAVILLAEGVVEDREIGAGGAEIAEEEDAVVRLKLNFGFPPPLPFAVAIVSRTLLSSCQFETSHSVLVQRTSEGAKEDGKKLTLSHLPNS